MDDSGPSSTSTRQHSAITVIGCPHEVVTIALDSRNFDMLDTEPTAVLVT
ncbi:hypothetical protein ANO14919_131910 [Xylariales sp. No.14919]|nr:hypothetical protein ANO14919_131910 [Xylariales sp. No.14919]